MEDSEFEWNDEKAKSNFKKHAVSFEEAATIFNDPAIATISDPDHLIDEERYISIGISVMQRLLIVVHIDLNNRIRLIGSRKANKAERKNYDKS